jgi:hypothetical protein
VAATAVVRERQVLLTLAVAAEVEVIQGMAVTGQVKLQTLLVTALEGAAVVGLEPQAVLAVVAG